MIHFILNEQTIATELLPGTTLLDFIRYHRHLMGTKIGCREGDCGACTVLIGEIKNNKIAYTSATSCLIPLGNANGKHIVTIEGINFPDTDKTFQNLNPIQHAMAEEGATQCGFCTPGFVMSLAGFCLSEKDPDQIISSIDGNICRCTGYHSIQRAAKKIGKILEERKDRSPVEFVTQKNMLPFYFTTIQQRLIALQKQNENEIKEALYFVGGGTDLYVQKQEEMTHASIHFLFDKTELNGITQEGNICIVKPSATVTDLKESAIMQKYFPRLDEYISLISSTPIRNMATVSGNFVNASPIGDLTIFFLALNAQIELTTIDAGDEGKSIALRKFYKGYKQLDKTPNEYIRKIWFELPDQKTQFHFEKVSKRTHLDIASVNSAMCIKTDDTMIIDAGISAGGVGPVPMYLEKTSAFLKGKLNSPQLIRETIELAQSEISPISDARGSAAYKRLLLGQLIKAHFSRFFSVHVNRL